MLDTVTCTNNFHKNFCVQLPCIKSMATGIVCSAICCVLTESDPSQESCGERVKQSREQICKFLQMINKDQAQEIFDKFCSSLLTILEKCLSTCLSTEGLRASIGRNFGLTFMIWVYVNYLNYGVVRTVWFLNWTHWSAKCQPVLVWGSHQITSTLTV